MSVIIGELQAEVTSDTALEGGGEGETQPAEGPSQQDLIDLLALVQERKERLGTD